MELQGKTALITGGGVRLGRAFALGLAKEGVNLAIHYNSSKSPAEQTTEEARSLGVNAVAIGADFNNLDDVQQLFPRALKSYACIDILINNAGIYLEGFGMETDRETWEKEFRIRKFMFWMWRGIVLLPESWESLWSGARSLCWGIGKCRKKRHSNFALVMCRDQRFL